MPILGDLPAAFASNGGIATAPEIVDFLLQEHAAHSDDEGYLQVFPHGSEMYLAKSLGEVIDYLLFADESIFRLHTRPLLTSVYGWNYIFGLIQMSSVHEKKLRLLESSAIKSVPDCVRKLEEVVSFLSHCADISESMKLPMRITSRLFSLMSVLLTIPLEDESHKPLSNFLLNSPQITAIEKWCERINDGCRIWSHSAIGWRKKIRSGEHSGPHLTKGRKAWWEWLGWSSSDKHRTDPTHEETNFVPDRRHNVLFAMVAVGTLFVFLGTSSASQS